MKSLTVTTVCVFLLAILAGSGCAIPNQRDQLTQSENGAPKYKNGDPKYKNEEDRIREMSDSAVVFEVNNSFTQDDIAKTQALLSRTKATVKKMKITIRARMKQRPLDRDYKILVKTKLLAQHKCTAESKLLSRPAPRCGKINENREIGTNEIFLTRKNNWSSTFKIDDVVAIVAVKEDPMARYETELLKLEIEPNVVSIKAMK